MSILSVSGCVHSKGNVRRPPGHILMECANTRGTHAIESGNSITVETLALTIFVLPSWVQMTPTKFMAVKFVPKIICHIICLQTINDWVNGVLLILNV